MSHFEIALVGGGGISQAHIASVKASGRGIRIAGLIDPNEGARKSAALAAATEGFASFDAFLASAASKNVKGIVVCTPPSARIPIVKSALGRGIGVLMEKPMAHTLADAKALAELAQKHANVITAIGYCHRFTPAIIDMKKRIAAGEIGQLTRFENTFAAPLAEKMATHWMSDPAISGGGSFIDTGCHSLDLFLHLIGTGKVASAIFTRAWPGRGESSATALMRSDAGIAGTIQSGWSEPARFTVAVVGTKGSLSYDYDFATELRFRSNEGKDEKLAVESHDVRFQRQLEAFADAVENKPLSVKPASFADGLVTATWVDQAQKLAAT